ncbi:coil containing protein [Vibrio phage 1.084.O._10N.261.49.F5]|nr:coil containing protein [Vibrio phage 1.084.O._10N.261.49.F5]
MGHYDEHYERLADEERELKRSKVKNSVHNFMINDDLTQNYHKQVSGAWQDRFPRHEVCRDHYPKNVPTHEADFPVGKINQPLNKCSHIEKYNLDNSVQEKAINLAHKFQMDILEQGEKLLRDYFLKVHNLDIEHLTKVCNNFKLKDCFEKHSYPQRDDYLYKGEVFLVKEFKMFWGGKSDVAEFIKVGGW